MAFCNVCKSKILFFEKWTHRNMCNTCYLKLISAKRSVQIIQDSLKIIKSTKNPETGIRRVLLTMFHLDYLTPFVLGKIIALPELSEMKDFMRSQYSVYKKQIEQLNITKKKKIVVPPFESYKNLYDCPQLKL